MQKILTIGLLDRLISQGYLYCLSRTTSIVGEDADTCITLVPVREEPSLEDLPEPFDTYFEIGQEPREMAMGVNETIILVDISHVDFFAALSV